MMVNHGSNASIALVLQRRVRVRRRRGQRPVSTALPIERPAGGPPPGRLLRESPPPPYRQGKMVESHLAANAHARHPPKHPDWPIWFGLKISAVWSLGPLII
jgi:hypothetical protein